MKSLLNTECALAFIVFICAAVAAGQQSNPAVPQQSASGATGGDPKPISATALPDAAANPQIVPPILITQDAVEYSYEALKKKISGTCLVSFTVDTDGTPRNIHVVKSIDPTLDANAVQAIGGWRFKPAMKKGEEPASFHLNDKPVPFDLTAEVNFRLLDARKTGAVIAIPETPGDPGTLLWTGRSRVIAPKPIHQVAPKYPRSERRHRISGDCTLQMIIDSEGVPQNVHVVKSLEAGLDQSAIDAVRQWRYNPASVDGVPVPVESRVIVKFQLKGFGLF